MTGAQLAAWLADHKISIERFRRLGGPDHRVTQRLIQSPDRPIPPATAALVAWYSIPDCPLRSAVRDAFLGGIEPPRLPE